jgi:hypothetical protein
MTISTIARFPSTSEIRLGMGMANSKEGADYLEQRLNELADQSKFMSKSPEVKEHVISAVKQFVHYTDLTYTVNEDFWSGEHVETSKSKNMHKNLAAVSVKELEDKVTDLRFDYAVSQDGHYVRRYISKGQALDYKSVADLDEVFNAWLTSKDYMVKDGYLSKTSDQKTSLGQDEVKKLLVEEGLKEFLEKKGFNVAIKECSYPGEEKLAKAKQEVASAAVEGVSKATKQSKTVEAEPEEAPQAGTTGRR